MSEEFSKIFNVAVAATADTVTSHRRNKSATFNIVNHS